MATDTHDTHSIVQLAKLQDTFYRVSYSSRQDSETVSPVFRSQIIDWFINVTDYCDLEHNIAAIALNYFDRFAAKAPRKLPNEVEILRVAAACIYLAQKVHGVQNFISLSPAFLCRLCRRSSSFTIPMLHRYEQMVLDTLQWHVNPTTALDFLDIIVHSPSIVKVRAKEIIEQLLHEPALALYSAPTVTLVALFIASRNVKSHILKVEKWKGIFGIQADEWKECILFSQCKLGPIQSHGVVSPKTVLYFQ